MRNLMAMTWFMLISLITHQVYAERIKDVATLAGVRTNQLVGYGLIVGLNGSGDKTGQYTQDTFANLLTGLDIVVPAGTKITSKKRRCGDGHC